MEDAAQGGDSLLVSVDGGVTFQRAAVIRFDAGTPAGTTKTVIVKAIDDALAQGDRQVMVSTSSQSDDPNFNRVAVRNVKVTVLDNDQPGVRITETDGDTVVLEGAAPYGITDSYTVALSKAPAPGNTVTVTLSADDARLVLSSADPRYNATTHAFTFDSTNWSTPATVGVAAPRARRRGREPDRGPHHARGHEHRPGLRGVLRRPGEPGAGAERHGHRRRRGRRLRPPDRRLDAGRRGRPERRHLQPAADARPVGPGDD